MAGRISVCECPDEVLLLGTVVVTGGDCGVGFGDFGDCGDGGSSSSSPVNGACASNFDNDDGPAEGFVPVAGGICGGDEDITILSLSSGGEMVDRGEVVGPLQLVVRSRI